MRCGKTSYCYKKSMGLSGVRGQEKDSENGTQQ